MIKKISKFIGKTLLITVAVTPIVFLVARDAIFTLMNPGIETTFILTGEITDQTAADFKKFMDKHDATLIPAKKITVDISSPGGSVMDGMQIIDALHKSRSKVHTVARGMVASMAALIFIEGDTRVITRGSVLLFHEVRISLPTGEALLDDDFFDMVNNVQNVSNLLRDISRLDSMPEKMKLALLIDSGTALFKTKGTAKLAIILHGLTVTDNNAQLVVDGLTVFAEQMLAFNLEAIDVAHRKTGISFTTLSKLLNNNKDNLVNPEQALDLGLATEVR